MSEIIYKIIGAIKVKYIISISTLFLVLLLSFPCIAEEVVQTGYKDKNPQYVPEEIIIKFKTNYSEQWAYQNWINPMLVILLDFADTDMSKVVIDPEKAWSGLIFGNEKGQGNHYWNEVSRGQLQLLKANESYGEVNNGVLWVKLSQYKPESGQYVVEQQTWIPDALDIAGNYINFAEYDIDKDGILTNQELAVFFVLNLPYENISGSGAQANILINHITGGVKIQKFLRTQYDYTSIGVNMHELAHHLLSASHFVSPHYHGLMGMGAYNEDPVITKLHNGDHLGTSPAHLIGYNKIVCSFVEPANITSTTYNVKLYSPHTDDYNVIALPVTGGYLYLENRTKEGYDYGIPFINDNGGLFATDVSQYITPLQLSTDCGNLGDYYSYQGHNDEFSLGGYTITNISPAGPVMSCDIIYNEITPVIEKYKYRYWVNDPEREGYRIWKYSGAQEGQMVDIDFSSFPYGDDPNGYFTINLAVYYNTGEIRSANLEAQWPTASKYLKISKVKISNPYTYADDAIISLSFNEAEPYEQSAIVSVDHNGFQSSFRLINLPKYAAALEGDINKDGEVDSIDLQMCVNIILGIEDFKPEADVNGDTFVDALDLQRIVNSILGI
ncbi:MAG: dockerin type I domain-containing protein [Candidatus Omnitrophota bacterium]